MTISKSKVSELEKIAKEIRLKTIEIIWAIGNKRKAHPGASLSIADIITVLYFHSMNIDTKRPSWESRDRFVLSKGHACPVLYVALAKIGYFNEKILVTLRHVDSILQGHPDMRKTPGIDMTTGSLGHGLSLGTGIAIAGKHIDELGYYTYVVLGDGELQEGLIWEAAIAAVKYKLDNLIVFVDCNGWQSCFSVNENMPFDSFRPRWQAFGWKVIEINGHSIRQIVDSVEEAKICKGQPTVILAKTIKGKGVSYMENDNSWHQRAPDDDQMKIAERELKAERQL